VQLTFHLRQPFRKAKALAHAVQRGAAKHGDTVEIEYGFEQVRVGGLVLFGIGGMAREIYDAYRMAGRPIVFWDKGYSRGDWYRVAVNSFQPLDYFQADRPPDRLAQLGLNPVPYEVRGDAILLDGASNKYCLWQGLGNWIEWGQSIVDKIRQHSDRPIIYRPRPSHNLALDPPRITGATLSEGGPLVDDLRKSALVVSYGGNIGYDCALAGVPHFAIGDSIARPISETAWAKVGDPFIPDWAAHRQWLSDVAYCQWRIEEIESGLAWAEIKGRL
jgi:hypothetical protein